MPNCFFVLLIKYCTYRYILACVENERLYAFVLPKHLLPLLGTLMQLVYSPNSIEIVSML